MSIAEAIRAEFRSILDKEEPFTAVTCANLERLAKAAKALLQATGGVPAALTEVMGDPSIIDVSDGQVSWQGGTSASVMSDAPVAETFGVKVIHELIAALPAILDRPKKQDVVPPISMSDIIGAIGEARALNLGEVEARLMDQLEAMLPPKGAIPVVSQPSANGEENAPMELDVLQQKTSQLSPADQRKLLEMEV